MKAARIWIRGGEISRKIKKRKEMEKMNRKSLEDLTQETQDRLNRLKAKQVLKNTRAREEKEKGLRKEINGYLVVFDEVKLNKMLDAAREIEKQVIEEA